jgi:hypothetical protein
VPKKPPFKVDPYTETTEPLPEDILKPHPVDRRTIKQQLKDNLKIKITKSEASFKSGFEF